MKVKREEILKGIIVQGSLLDTDIDQYVAILEDHGTGKRFSDPFENMIASVFDICIDGDIDPWSIDIRWFTKMFASLIDTNFRDFFIAGYLINSAWKILSIKSDRSITKWTSEPDLPEEDISDFQDPTSEFVDSLEIKEPVVKSVKRKVFLVELLDAMKESFEYGNRRRLRSAASIVQDNYDIEKLFDKLHPEEPEKESARVFDIIMSFGHDEILLDDLLPHIDYSFQALFIYCLFLAKDKKIDLYQERAFAPIYIRNIFKPAQ